MSLFTLFVVPSIYVLIAADHTALPAKESVRRGVTEEVEPEPQADGELVPA